MRKLLKLQHHKHTGKLIHHRHTSYRALGVVLALVGGLFVYVQWSVQQTAQADSYVVQAIVPAPVPTTPAVITSPADGTITSNPNVTVSGTCPIEMPGVVVAIYGGSVLFGSVPCSSGGFFTVQITLAVGNNTLVAKTTTITGDSGPDSAPVHITYIPLATPVTTASPSGSPRQAAAGGGSQKATGSPLVIHSDKSFVVFGPTTAAEWTGTVSGGRTPYTLTIKWGDDSTEVHKNVGAGPLRFSHNYSVTASVSYVIRLSVTDANGTRTSTIVAAVTPFVLPNLGSIFKSGGGGISPYTLFAIYWAYICLLCVFGILWMRAHRYAYAKIPAGTRRTRKQTPRRGNTR